MTGTLYLVGTGPGDPDLLTLKAARLLAGIAVVAYPRKAGERPMAYRIAQSHINPEAVHLPADIPMSADRAPAQAAYDRLGAQMLAHLRAGRSIAYLCEGDPLYYGSAMYLVGRIAPFAPVTTIPGITSLTAAAAAIGRPLAARNEILKILPAPLPDATLHAELEGCTAAAIIKVGRHFDRIRAVLGATGHAENAVVVEYATGADQRITALKDFASDARPYFSTILCYRGQEDWGR